MLLGQLVIMRFGYLVVEAFVVTLRLILTYAQSLSYSILDAVFVLIYGKPKCIPSIKDPLLVMPATKLAEKIRKREISSEEVMRAHIRRTLEVQPMINAVVDERYKTAIEEAKNVDRFIAEEAKSEEEIARETPLLGVPFTCKESIGVKGMCHTIGVVAFKDMKTEKDSEVVNRYRKAGAIPFVVTNIPEFCLWLDSANHIYGITRNPYNRFRISGGSSGGESALIASGGATMGIGNDLAGSIRMPAFFCGIYGHKGTSDAITNKGAVPEGLAFYRYVCTGPMCRYVDDLLLLTKLLVGDDKRLDLNQKVDFRDVKIYYMEGLKGFLKTSIPEIRQAVKKAADHFANKFGSKVEEVYFEEMEDAFSIWECKLLELDPPPFKSALAGEGGKINLFVEFIKNIFGRSVHTMPALYYAFVEKRDKDEVYHRTLEKFNSLQAKFDKLFQEKAIFLFPTHREPAMHQHYTIPKYYNIGYTAVFNVLGLPSTHIPTGLCDGLPIGIQAISGKFQDHLTLAAAKELDLVFGGWSSPVPIDI